MAHDPLACMLDMLLAIKKIQKFVEGVSREQFISDDLVQSAVFGQCVMVGEAANRVPRSDQDRLSQIPWATIVAFRNRLIHGYDSVDWDLVFSITNEIMPACRVELEKLVPPEEEYEIS